MSFDWYAWGQRHPRLLNLFLYLKRKRTKVALVIVPAWFIHALVLNEPPDISLLHPSRSVILGVLLVLAGVAFRLAAHGNLRKKESLASTGVYSLCRHPLYLGSMLITYGFCVLLGGLAAGIVATAYFLIFYGCAVIWEEARLTEQYGDAHADYRRRVPMILPLGRYHPGGFQYTAAIRNGGALLVAMAVVLLVALEVVSDLMRRP